MQRELAFATKIANNTTKTKNTITMTTLLLLSSPVMAIVNVGADKQE
jgi:hypothetical protein